ncbi:hypothetical protein O1Q79_01788 [Lonepinella sp. MS14434]|uniref:hypothetical protein n=2 Tax=unclassified Lonepinella TaxID=2642006 RepID=UPI0036DCEF3D
MMATLTFEIDVDNHEVIRIINIIKAFLEVDMLDNLRITQDSILYTETEFIEMINKNR